MSLNIKENYTQVADLPTQQALKNVNENLKKIDVELKSLKKEFSLDNTHHEITRLKIAELEARSSGGVPPSCFIALDGTSTGNVADFDASTLQNFGGLNASVKEDQWYYHGGSLYEYVELPNGTYLVQASIQVYFLSAQDYGYIQLIHSYGTSPNYGGASYKYNSRKQRRITANAATQEYQGNSGNFYYFHSVSLMDIIEIPIENASYNSETYFSNRRQDGISIFHGGSTYPTGPDGGQIWVTKLA